MKRILVCGAGGFIGSHLVKKLVDEGHWVLGVDLKQPEFSPTMAHKFMIGDLRSTQVCNDIFYHYEIDEIYQLAADMGGAGYIFTGENDAAVMHNSATINLNIAEYARSNKIKKVLYTSSACIYPEYNQLDPDNPKCAESDAYPAAPDSEYGWEKLFSERLYAAYNRNCGLDVRVVRLHNIYGPEGTWQGGKEKAPAALCRKVAEAKDGDVIEVWGKGDQTRSFLYIDACIEGLRRVMESDVCEPMNVGSEEMIAINDLAKMVIDVSGKKITLKNVEGPEGVRGRNSDNDFIESKIGWNPVYDLRTGIEQTYDWIKKQVGNV